MSKGTNAERELCTELWNKGFATLRAPGSGSIDRPSPDVVALKGDVMNYQAYAFELKASPDGCAYFETEEIDALEEWSERARAMPLVAVKPDLRAFDDWLIMSTKSLRNSDGGLSITTQNHKQCSGLEYFGNKVIE